MLLVNTSVLWAQNAQSARAQAGRGLFRYVRFPARRGIVQLTVEDQGLVTGLISRYGNSAGDKREFLDQFFQAGQDRRQEIDIHYENPARSLVQLDGIVERGDGQNVGDEGYYVLKGSSRSTSPTPNKKTTTKSQQVAFKSFPKDGLYTRKVKPKLNLTQAFLLRSRLSGKRR